MKLTARPRRARTTPRSAGLRRLWATAVTLVLAGSAGLFAAGPAVAADQPPLSTMPGDGCTVGTVVGISTANSGLFQWDRWYADFGSWSASTQVGQGWAGIRLIAADGGRGRDYYGGVQELYALDTAGSLRLYTAAEASGMTPNGYTGGAVIRTGLSDVTTLLGVGNGVLMTIDGAGALRWYRYTGKGWDPGSGTVIGTGWDGFSQVFSGGGGILYGIRKSDGALVWYRDLHPGSKDAQWQGPKQVGQGWAGMKAVLGHGQGYLYAVNSAGTMLQYQHTGYLTGAATWANNGTGVTIGSGWSGYRNLTADPTACPMPLPARTDSTTRTTYLVHGADMGAGWNCADYWRSYINRMHALGMTGPIHTVGFYEADAQCDAQVNHVHWTNSIEDVAKSLAWWIYDHDSANGEPVDIVAHSMGGLVLRAALDGVQQHKAGYPPILLVVNAVSMGAPQQGTNLTKICQGPLSLAMCDDMAVNSAFIRSLGYNPESAIGTDWTLIAVENDAVVNSGLSDPVSPLAFDTALAGQMNAGHRVLYRSGVLGTTDVAHMSLVSSWGTGYDAWHAEYNGSNHGGTQTVQNYFSLSGWAWPSAPGPIDWAINATRYWSLW